MTFVLLGAIIPDDATGFFAFGSNMAGSTLGRSVGVCPSRAALTGNCL